MDSYSNFDFAIRFVMLFLWKFNQIKFLNNQRSIGELFRLLNIEVYSTFQVEPIVRLNQMMLRN